MIRENKKKILIFSLTYHPFVGGAEIAIKEITERLNNFFDFDMITVNLDGKQLKVEENFNGINKIYRVGSGIIGKYLFPWLAYIKAKKLHRYNNYQIIWAIMANQAGWAALKFKKKNNNIPYLLTLQEGDSEIDIWLRTFFIRPIYKSIYRNADRIQAISKFLACRAKRMGAKCPIFIIPNGVNFPNFFRYKIKSDIKLIFSSSRLVKKNGLIYLIKSIPILKKRYGIKVNLKIVGQGPLYKKLDKLIKNLGLVNSNGEKILEGEVSNNQVYKYLSCADVFVRPSISEGFGNSFIEAMSMGVPVIGTKVGGITDFLEDGKTGWFCEVNNPDSIAEKIHYILDYRNKKEVDLVIKNAKDLVKNKYSWSLISSKMLDFFNIFD